MALAPGFLERLAVFEAEAEDQDPIHTVRIQRKRTRDPRNPFDAPECTPGPSTSSDKRGAVGGVERDKDTEDILNCILPPREWEQDDELIRQVTINCAERGLLLLRVRDELRMTAVAYQKLYESSIAFGIRKALYAEQGKEDMAEKVEQLTAEKNKLQLQVVDLKAKADMIERRAKELRLAEEKQHAEEISFLRRANQQLKMKALSSGKKKDEYLAACTIVKNITVTNYNGERGVALIEQCNNSLTKDED
ncbi:unnamed protein product [Bemisia tabaci]|uniref:Uncharacterized protein n=1 Tax=Bemisia tabaci TaxID=7038 RepID=A0A9P0F6D9_BEMTA|nr:unnamed protein product [Bemisia tabaci]